MEQSDEVVEKSPKGGFSRVKYCSKKFKKCIGAGAFKKVYKGLDHQNAIEIAWNTVELGRLPVCNPRSS